MNHTQGNRHSRFIAVFVVFALFSCISDAGNNLKRTGNSPKAHASSGVVLSADGVAPTPPPRRPRSSSAHQA
jgi:hypothetical protein